MVKYAFSFLVVAMVSHIPVKSRMAVNYVKSQESYFRWEKDAFQISLIYFQLRKVILQISLFS